MISVRQSSSFFVLHKELAVHEKKKESDVEVTEKGNC